jgi:hypothetical protein
MMVKIFATMFETLILMNVPDIKDWEKTSGQTALHSV